MNVAKVLILIPLFLAGACIQPALAAERCSANVRVSQTGTEEDSYGIKYTLEISVTAPAPCSLVHYTVVAQVRDSSGDSQELVELWSSTVFGGSTTDTAEFRVSSGFTLKRWSVRGVTCQICD